MISLFESLKKGKASVIGSAFFKLSMSCTNKLPLTATECTVCERITLFSESKEFVNNQVWEGVNTATNKILLLYFTGSSTYMAFGKEALLKNYKYKILKCDKGISLFTLRRLDAQPFHMENKMSFTDTASLYHNQPMMLCSDVETLHKFVPDFNKTEGWLQLVMHEYFHSYQFSHKATFTYLAQTIKVSADTLHKIYVASDWFSHELEKENDALLNAVANTSKDSMQLYISQFIQLRENRRKKYEQLSEFKLTAMENFWETSEGTARYAEYYMAGNFNMVKGASANSCDSLFKKFEYYSFTSHFEERKEFKQRTKIMPEYYYATGFNLCRLMYKINISYKNQLFDNPSKGLYQIFYENVRR
jgi:hypothetical protein